MKSPDLRICGVMSGSSLDGLDLAICHFEIDEHQSIDWEIIKAETIPIEQNVKDAIIKSYRSSSTYIYQAEQIFSKYCSKSISSFINSSDLVDYIGFHGHTIFHEPEQGYTVQIGNANLLAQALGIKVIADLRNKDICLGGQGAPLAPIVEKYLFSEYDSFLNLGGIVNVSIHKSDIIVAYDLTACNQALNHLAQQKGLEYDNKGKIAISGQINNDLLINLSKLDYLKQLPPKSLSNTWVQQKVLPILDQAQIPLEDKMATMVEHISNEIFTSLNDVGGAKKMMMSGGGVHNDYMTKCIRNKVSKIGVITVLPSEEITDYKESLLMALMAFLRVNELPNCLASVTGASRNSCSGIIYNPAL